MVKRNFFLKNSESRPHVPGIEEPPTIEARILEVTVDEFDDPPNEVRQDEAFHNFEAQIPLPIPEAALNENDDPLTMIRRERLRYLNIRGIRQNSFLSLIYFTKVAVI